MFNQNHNFEASNNHKKTRKEPVTASIGSNLKFESDEIRNKREALEKAKQYRQKRDEEINNINSEVLKLIKELKNIPEHEQKEIKDRIASLKLSMNEKLKEQKFEIELDKKDKQNRIKAKKAKKQQIVQQPLFDLILKITDETVVK